MKKNKVERVSLSGGLIGMFVNNPKRALQERFDTVNAEGWHVRQVIDDATGNLVVYIVRLIILFLTFLLWTPANGYYLILERED